MLSGVVLSMSWVRLDADTLRARLDAAFPGEFLPPRDQGTFVVDGPVRAQFLINSAIPGAAGTFMLFSMPDRYSEVSDFAKHIDDPGLRALATGQAAWLSIDLIDPKADVAGAWRFIGKALAALAPPDAAVFVNAADNTCQLFDDALRQKLASGVWQ